ncbi:hypothetical protein LTR95_007887, partial [Oleoguttula sp. CCFEE 5521]
MNQYHSFALRSRYSGNPESISVMILTLYELWVALDKAAIRLGLSLAEYDPEIPLAPLHGLLLPFLEQMERFQDVEQLFRPQVKSRPSGYHRQLREKIKTEARLQDRTKKEEFWALKAQYVELDKRCNMMGHTVITKPIIDINSGHPVIVEDHLTDCEKCFLETKRNALEITIYERPLPDNANEAKTVIFELMLPEWFRHWRDARCFILHDVLHGRSNEANLPKKTYVLSKEDPHLFASLSRDGSSDRIVLLSESKPNFRSTHYSNQRIAGLQERDVCISNALRYQYFDCRTGGYVATPTFENQVSRTCTYTLSNGHLLRFVSRHADQPDGPPPNFVLASQQQSPADMTLEEFRDLSLHDRCLAFLSDARAVAVDWLDQLLEAAYVTADPIRHVDFVTRSVETALICASTCDVGDADLRDMMKVDAIASTLLFCSMVNHNGKDYKVPGAGQQFRLLQARLKRILPRALPLLVRNQKALHTAVLKSWAAYEPSAVGWVAVEGAPDWVRTTTAARSGMPLSVHFSCLTGALLVEGSPIAQPPKDITESPIYKTLFGVIALEVMPSFVPGFQHSAKRAVAGHSIRLGKPHSRAGEVKVQITRDGLAWEVIPPSLFKGVSPTHFVGDYVHWYSFASGNVVLQHTKDLWLNNGAVHWTLHRDSISSGRWCLSRLEHAILPLLTNTAKRIADVLEPLAAIYHVHHILNDAGLLHIEVPSLRLSFELRPRSTVMMSKEHPNTAIDRDQSTGVFIGLRNKLVLAPSSGGFRVLLLPEVRDVPYAHEDGHVAIELPTALMTRVHAVQIDDQLGRLIDNSDMDCKLYIAELHALPSSCMADPLTHATGTEAALSVLDRGDVRSFTQLTQWQVDRLAAIAKLSPTREYYPKHKALMQKASWDNELSYHAQHHWFRDAVRELLRLAGQANFFYPDTDMKMPQLAEENEILSERAAIRSAAFRISGFGAEAHTSSNDQQYLSRDSKPASARMDNVTTFASLFARSQQRQHWPSLSPGHIWQAMEPLSKVHGSTAKFNAHSLRYTATLMEHGLKSVLEVLPAAQDWLSNPVEYRQHKASVAMWFSTIAFNTIALGCSPKPSMQIKTPDALEFDPQQGRTFDRRVLYDMIIKRRILFSKDSEAHLTRSNKELDDAYKNRRYVEWMKKSNDAIAHFTTELAAQWPSVEISMPELRLSKADKYIRVDLVMKHVKVKYTAWHDNKALSVYLRKIETASAVAQQEVSIMTCGYTSESDLFEMPAPQKPKRCRDFRALAATKASTAKSETTEVSSFKQLNALLKRLSRATGSSVYEGDYISRLQDSASSLERRQTSQMIPHVPSLLHLAAHRTNCEQDMQAAYASFAGAVSLPNFAAPSTVQQWPRICPTLFLRQLARDRWPLLDRPWQKAIVAYGVALTALQQAERMLKSAQQSQDADVISKLRNEGHVGWEPSEHPEPLLMEIESGLLVRGVQHSIAEEMRMPR